VIPVQVLGVRRGVARKDADRDYPDQDEVDRVWVAFRTPKVPGRGVVSLVPKSMRRSPEGDDVEARESEGIGLLANRLVAVRISPSGRLMVEERRTGAEYAGLCELMDEPDAGDLYTFSAGRGVPAHGGRPVSQHTLARGPLVGAVETRWTMPSAGPGHIEVRQVVALYPDSPLVRLRLDIENAAPDHRLRARFPVGAGDAAIAGAALGVERRAPETAADPDPALERPARTAPAQRFVAAAAGAHGLALFAAGFFEYEWTPARELVVTLLRAVGELSRAGLPERPGHAAWPEPTPEAQELGAHTIELALLPVGESELARPGGLERLWEEAFLPVQGVFV
jgi:hypothetical protein